MTATYDKLNTFFYGVLAYHRYQVLIGTEWWSINPNKLLFPQVRGMRAYRILDISGNVIKQSSTVISVD